MDSNVTYFVGARWATLKGSFTPEELREIADEIEKKDKDFKEVQDGNKV